MKKRIYQIALVLILIVNGLIGCKSKEAVKIESFTLSKNDSLSNNVIVGESDEVTFYVTPTDIDEKNIELVTENPSVAKCLIQDVRLVNGKRIVIVSFYGLMPGQTLFYIKDTNGEVQSEKISVVVQEAKEVVDNSRMVYLNHSGSNYHYSSECAGKSSYESTLNKAEALGKEPCSKCVN